MNKHIIYTNEDGTVVILNAPINWKSEYSRFVSEHGEWNGISVEDITYDLYIDFMGWKDVPEGLEWRIATTDALPASRNYRNAWTDANPTETVDVDLEKAKECQKELMVQKAHERVEADLMGNKDFSVVQAEIEEIDFDSITDLDTLYNTFPASIDKRNGMREYIIHESK